MQTKSSSIPSLLNCSHNFNTFTFTFTNVKVLVFLQYWHIPAVFPRSSATYNTTSIKGFSIMKVIHTKSIRLLTIVCDWELIL